MAAQFQFVMRSGPTPGATFALEGDQLTIGRDSSSAVAINDAEISRKHARLTFQGGKYVIEDLGSTNGTFVNGQRLVSAVVLKSGDVVSFGEQIVLMYEALASDPGATMISARKAASRPISTPVATPGPAPVPAPAPAPQQYYSRPTRPLRSRNRGIWCRSLSGQVCLVVICLCVGALWYIDANYLWCTFFPFISGCG